MKCRSLLMLLIVPVFFACNNTAENNGTIADTIARENHNEHATESQEEHAGTLALNNGAKWQSDEGTRKHAAQIIAETKGFNAKTNADISTYHSFAVAMQTALNSLISDCKMKGPDHEALHLWLEPLLQNVGNLKKINTVEEGKHVTEQLANNAEKFNQYFN